MMVGDIREYEYHTGGKANGGYTEEVTEVEKQKDVSSHVTVRTSIKGAESYKNVFAVSDAGISMVSASDKKLAKPTLLLKLPATVGTKWEEGSAKFEVTAEEEVEVPAGKFQAVRVESTNGSGTTMTWYATSVGIVKMTSDAIPTVLELKAFKSGK